MDHETGVRLGVFLGTLLLMLGWEQLRPFRVATEPRATRRRVNLALVVIDTLIARILLPLGATGAAALAARNDWGLLNHVRLPQGYALIGAVLALEIVIYWQHRLMHVVPWLWRLHRVHHSDPDFDATTGVRFHPLEALISAVIKLGAVVVLGVPVPAVIAFEVSLSASSLFNHGNVRLPAWLEPMARWVLVTPDVHRIHHSTARVETDSNFGFLLTWWDRLFGTYRPVPTAGQEGVRIGLDELRGEAARGLGALLRQPWR